MGGPGNGAEQRGPCRRRRAFRLETRARELAVMARLSLQGRSRRETEFPQRERGEACESA